MPKPQFSLPEITRGKLLGLEMARSAILMTQRRDVRDACDCAEPRWHHCGGAVWCGDCGNHIGSIETLETLI